jgi:hypothetical protein
MTTYNVNTKISRLSGALHRCSRANQLYLSETEADGAVAVKIEEEHRSLTEEATDTSAGRIYVIASGCSQ